MPPLTTLMLSNGGRAIDQIIPNQIDSFGDQSEIQKRLRSEERKLFRKLVSKLAGNFKDHQTAFLINQARKISRTTYVQVALDSVPKIPDYAELEKKNRKTSAHVHNLIDKILPLSAGSQSFHISILYNS